MINKLLAERGDYFFEELEVIDEIGLKGSRVLDSPEIVHVELPGARAPSRYLITRKNSVAAQLLPKFNQALIQRRAAPKAKEFWIREHNGVIYTR